MARVRGAEELERELAAIASDIRSETTQDYRERLLGSQAALQWALGRLSTAPASRRLIERPDSGDLYHEAMWADEIVMGVRWPPQGPTRSFAGGVAGALMWVLERTSESPSPSTTPGLRDFDELMAELDGNRRLLQAPPPQWDSEELDEQRGVVAALSWAAGVVSLSPVSGRSGTPDVAAIEGELALAEQMSHISAAPGPRSRDFSGGVYDALAWVLQRTDRQPGP